MDRRGRERGRLEEKSRQKQRGNGRRGRQRSTGETVPGEGLDRGHLQLSSAGLRDRWDGLTKRTRRAEAEAEKSNKLAACLIWTDPVIRCLQEAASCPEAYTLILDWIFSGQAAEPTLLIGAGALRAAPSTGCAFSKSARQPSRRLLTIGLNLTALLWFFSLSILAAALSCRRRRP